MAKKRKLTPFLCQELLYDYAIEALDTERKIAVEDFLKENAESRKTLEAIRKGFWYADELSKIEVNSELVRRLEESENIVSISKKVSSYNDYPDWLKWSLVAILGSGCVALIVVIIPWAKLVHRVRSDDKTVVLAPLSKENEAREQGEQSDEADNEHESSGDYDESGAPVEDDAAVAAPAPTKVVALKPTPVATIPPLEKPSKVAASTPKPQPIEQPDEQANENEAAANDQAVEEAAPQTKHETKPSGFVYRGFMTIPNIEDVSDQIVQQIKELGGEKAGEVDLGWKRGSLRYFHFMLPESNQEKLLEALRAYGPVRISKDPHPRVMPEGQVRFILSIDAK